MNSWFSVLPWSLSLMPVVLTPSMMYWFSSDVAPYTVTPPALSVPVPAARKAMDEKLRASGSFESCSAEPVTPIVVFVVSMTGASPVTMISSLTETDRVIGSVAVALGATATLPITLSVSVKEEIIVTGEAPVIDTTKTTIGVTGSSEQLSKLPLARNFSSIAFRAAGTGTDKAGGVTVYGATSLENQYIIDGVNTTGIKLS